MVEYAIDLDTVFSSLADATRRDILSRVLIKERTVGELAEAHTHLSFAAVAKHIAVLEDAHLVMKKREGRFQIISANPRAISAATAQLEQYQKLWDARFEALDTLLKK